MKKKLNASTSHRKNSFSVFLLSAKRFTLIELLMVIAIIGILSAILFPALSSARAAGIRAKCFGNLKQVGLGFQMYINTFDAFPVKDSRLSSGSVYWCHALIASFISGSKNSPFKGTGYNTDLEHYSQVMACPTILQVKYKNKMNVKAMYGIKDLYDDTIKKLPVSIKKLTYPSRSMLAGDVINNAKSNYLAGNMYKNDANLDWNVPAYSARCHVQQITPTLMHDGHVQSLPISQLWYDNDLVKKKPWSSTSKNIVPWFQ